MSTQDNDSKGTNNTQQSNNSVKRPLPSGTVTTIRSSIFELGSTDKTNKK